MQKIINQNLVKYGKQNYLVSPESYSGTESMALWVVRRKNLYSDELFRQMVNMVEYGIFKQIKSHFVRDKVNIKQEAPLEPLNLEHFVLPLIMLATGLSVSALVFALELIIFKN